MHFPISLHKHTSCIMYSTVLCISAKQAMRKETEDSGTAPKSTLSKGTHHHRARVTYQISHQTHHYSLGFSGCSWGHSVSVLQIRRAAWVASYRWSRRVILLPRGILLSSTSTNNHQRPQKKNPDATVRTDAVIPFSLKHPERTGLTRKIGQQSLKTVEIS